IGGHRIADLTAMEAEHLTEVLAELDRPRVKPVLDDLIVRLRHLVDIGLGYLSLDRETRTLSGGESQRIKMVRHLSSSLTEMLYVFDEPSAGLHARDVHRLGELLSALRDRATPCSWSSTIPSSSRAPTGSSISAPREAAAAAGSCSKGLRPTS
ncbi:hypothetical protein ACWDE9_32405, partial [Streptomyces olivaceoviridis]